MNDHDNTTTIIAEQPHTCQRCVVVTSAAYVFWAFLALIQNAESVELVLNGSFEEGGPFPGSNIVVTGWDDGQGIGSDIGFVAWEYPSGDCGNEWCSGFHEYVAPGPPSGGVSGPIGRGRHYAANFGRGNGGGGVLGSATQHIDLTDHADKPFDFSVWLASDVGDTDYAIVTLELFSGENASGDSLGVVRFDGNDLQSPFILGSANAQGMADPTVPATLDNWTFYRSTGRIPLNAASAAVVLEDGTVTGVNGDGGYVDLVSLQVVPEPSSICVLLFAGSVLVPRHVWSCRRPVRNARATAQPR